MYNRINNNSVFITTMLGLIIFSPIICAKEYPLSEMIEINDDNWEALLKGEWMINFWTPNCSACDDLEPIWKKLPELAGKRNVHVAKAERTENQNLLKKFRIFYAPIIFHAINGEFRNYDGPHTVDSILKYVEEKEWKRTRPINIRA